MTAAEIKAKELVDKFMHLQANVDFTINNIHLAKYSAGIVCDEVMKVVPRYEYGQGERIDSQDWEFWQSVKSSINKI